VSIFVSPQSKVIVQGITGSEGFRHTLRMLRAGTNIVGGVNPRKAGTSLDADGHILPVFASCSEAVEKTGAEVSVVFVPPRFTKDAVLEAIDGGLKTVVVITEGVPVQDSAYFIAAAKNKGVQIVGPNCPGLISYDNSTGKSCNVGIIPDDLVTNCTEQVPGVGLFGLVSKSGTLTYQIMHDLGDIGFSTALGIGGDPAIGTSHIDALVAFETDPHTAVVVLIGEIGGSSEEDAAKFIASNVTKPVVAYIAGSSAPEGKTMGHAGAIISGNSGTATSKRIALENAGVKVGATPWETAALAREAIKQVFENARKGEND
jgi:succinyl-CoA synthetase alpha subunit